MTEGRESGTAPGAAVFGLDELRHRRGELNDLYLEFLRCPAMTVGLYVLEAGGTDPQEPHREDEIYYVVGGHAILRVEDRDYAVTPGSVAFVPKELAHRFHSVTERLEVLVVFAPAETAPYRPSEPS